MIKLTTHIILLVGKYLMILIVLVCFIILVYYLSVSIILVHCHIANIGQIFSTTKATAGGVILLLVVTFCMGGVLLKVLWGI